MKPAAKSAGLPWAGLHRLLHTCATLLFGSGANATQVQIWLGHHSPAFTLATYVHLLADDLPDAAFGRLAAAGPMPRELHFASGRAAHAAAPRHSLTTTLPWAWPSAR